MNDRANTWIHATLLTALASLPARAAEDSALLKDLTSVIALLGLPCGQVVSAKRLKADDHVAKRAVSGSVRSSNASANA